MSTTTTDPTSTGPADVVDLAIIGGGPAGMSAALVAGRARLNTLIVNAEQPRNAVTTASHGFLTRDGAHPSELLAVSKCQLEKYPSVLYQQGTVATVEQTGEGFTLTLGNETQHRAKRLVIAAGYRDDLSTLGIAGLDAVYGKSVYPCPFCDGFEHADEALAIFGSEGVEHFVPIVAHWSTDLVVFTNGKPIDPSAVEELAHHGIETVTEPIERLRADENGMLQAVVLASGREVARRAGFIADDPAEPATPFAQQLGAALTTNAWGGTAIDATEAGATSVPGLYVVGDAKTGFAGLIAAAADGSACAAGIVHEVAAQRWAQGGRP